MELPQEYAGRGQHCATPTPISFSLWEFVMAGSLKKVFAVWHQMNLSYLLCSSWQKNIYSDGPRGLSNQYKGEVSTHHFFLIWTCSFRSYPCLTCAQLRVFMAFFHAEKVTVRDAKCFVSASAEITNLRILYCSPLCISVFQVKLKMYLIPCVGTVQDGYAIAFLFHLVV